MSPAITDPPLEVHRPGNAECAEEACRAGLYACPQTGSRLAIEDGWLVAETTGRRYPCRSGVPDFRAVRAEENDPASLNVLRLTRLATAGGWRAALKEVYGGDPAMWRYITRPARFLDLLPMTAASVVLEIGPGLGQFTQTLSERVAELYALEVSPGQAEFVATRLRQVGRRNAHVACGGDDDRFPYLSGSFDLVVCNLVFEWCASRNRGESVEAGQRRFLAEAVRVLKPGGSLFLATKNRFALRYLLGTPDEHADGMRFGNALPRWGMRLALRRRGKARPAGLLHSHWHLAALLREAGFVRLESFWATPEVRFPREYVSNRSDAIRAARRRAGFSHGDRRLDRLLLPFLPSALVRYLTPGLVFLARSPG